MMETVFGFMGLRELWKIAGLRRFAFGSIDLGVETGMEDRGDAMTAIRTQVVLESCYAGVIPPVDGVSVNFRDKGLIKKDALRSRRGFGGKFCIHPKQVAAVNDDYLSGPEEVE